MKKLPIIGTMPIILDMDADSSPDSKAEEMGETSHSHACLTSQNAYQTAPQLLYELQVEIFARVPCCEYWKLQFLNNQFSQLLKSSEIFRTRRELGLVKPYFLYCQAVIGVGLCLMRTSKVPRDFQSSLLTLIFSVVIRKLFVWVRN
uniref:F-box domain-containing protein n=1 Tax=Brassica oleracea TaxID=3712 RepID=A0A3P6BQS7_BRAOL|nr:unnamed protein product [Brassica oleracea]